MKTSWTLLYGMEECQPFRLIWFVSLIKVIDFSIRVLKNMKGRTEVKEKQKTENSIRHKKPNMIMRTERRISVHHSSTIVATADTDKDTYQQPKGTELETLFVIDGREAFDAVEKFPWFYYYSPMVDFLLARRPKKNSVMHHCAQC